MLRVRGVLILVALNLLLQAQPQLAQIRGEVVDARTGRPLSQARVRIRHVPVSVLSDSIGHFRLGNVPLGLVEFQVEKEGYEPYLSSVNMGSKAYLINVRLQAKATSVQHHNVPQGIEQYQERVYLHTDKPYYYPGEIIWMKAYVQYVDPNKRDSLSRTLYIDLVDAKQTTVKSLLLSVDSGRWRGSSCRRNLLPAPMPFGAIRASCLTSTTLRVFLQNWCRSWPGINVWISVQRRHSPKKLVLVQFPQNRLKSERAQK